MVCMIAVSALVATAPSSAAVGDGNCQGLEFGYVHDISEGLIWPSTYENNLIVNTFTPLKPIRGTDWEGIREYAGICNVVEDIMACLDEPQDPLGDCIPE